MVSGCVADTRPFAVRMLDGLARKAIAERENKELQASRNKVEGRVGFATSIPPVVVRQISVRLPSWKSKSILAQMMSWTCTATNGVHPGVESELFREVFMVQSELHFSFFLSSVSVQVSNIRVSQVSLVLQESHPFLQELRALARRLRVADDAEMAPRTGHSNCNRNGQLSTQSSDSHFLLTVQPPLLSQEAHFTLCVASHQAHHDSFFLPSLETVYTAHLYFGIHLFHLVSDDAELAVVWRDDSNIVLFYASRDQVTNMEADERGFVHVDLAVRQQGRLTLGTILGVFDLLGEVAALCVVVHKGNAGVVGFFHLVG